MATSADYSSDDDFEDFCQRCKLNTETKELLKENCLTDLDILVDIKEDEFAELGIKLGQRKAILKGCKSISKGEDDKPTKLIDPRSLPKTLASYADKVFGRKQPLKVVSFEEQCGNIEIHRCELKEVWRNEEHKIRKCVTGNVPEDNISKTILIVGQTGSGKTTLVDGIANYLFNVQWDDNHRVKMVDLTEEEKANKKAGKAFSQTDWITIYSIPHAAETRTRYTLNIIDTPGFCDTRGLERDKELLNQVKYLFENPSDHGIDMVNAIGFVAEASTARLTVTQQYIFNSVLSMFGKDVGDNIYAMATFSDCGEPPLIETMKAADVKFQRYFTFNNAALFSPTQELPNAEFMKMFWNLAMDSFDKFFIEFNKVDAKSIKLSAEVLREREQLANTLSHVQRQIKEKFQKLNQLKQEKEILLKHENLIKDSKNFEYYIDEERISTVKVPQGQYTTNCSSCHVTCHEVCKIGNDKKKHKCVAIDSNGYCVVCPNNCSWEEHYNQGYVYKLQTVRVKKTFSQMKNRYSQAKAVVEGIEPLISQLENEYRELEKKSQDLITKAAECIRRLRKIALKPKAAISDVEYIAMLIEEEKRQMENGWEERIQMLKEYKEKADILCKTEKHITSIE